MSLTFFLKSLVRHERKGWVVRFKRRFHRAHPNVSMLVGSVSAEPTSIIKIKPWDYFNSGKSGLSSTMGFKTGSSPLYSDPSPMLHSNQELSKLLISG